MGTQQNALISANPIIIHLAERIIHPSLHKIFLEGVPQNPYYAKAVVMKRNRKLYGMKCDSVSKGFKYALGISHGV